ncbi:alpha amylase catalytic subunit [Serratia fonticola]|uniref:Alpha amylase catalytic subunit n=1 Tax=Serratia fonticola TaxID=47917 RepID=A0A542BVD0_SERFO|nr:alpha-amylase family glycosyl hydrolase [Serratia fonticola]TQI82546.1 alpha amylase catalytic subunit [Serratia fonticola]TQI95437.1 alpha amylase catalytic subunit [Serratia fonticola]TVZ69932.1 alpha amylase catalytic subunit [Serratia fonticola]
MSSMRTAIHPTLYRIHPVSFRDGNGDGVGDVQGMMAALPYLKTLAVDGLLLPQALRPQSGVEVESHGLALWHRDGNGCICRSAAPEQQYMRRVLALEVMPFSIEKLVAVLNRHRSQLAESIWSTGDVDQPRIVSHWGQGDLRSAQAFLTLLALLPAPICLYQGEELGLPHAANLQDPHGAQTPMPWHEAPEQVTAGEIHWYQQVAIEHRALAISRQQQDSNSTLRYCQALLALRQLPVIQGGELNLVSLENGVLRLLITHQDQCLEALINLQPYTQPAAPSEATMPLAWQYGAEQEGHQWVLAGFASAIFTRNVNCESRGVTHG